MMNALHLCTGLRKSLKPTEADVNAQMHACHQEEELNLHQSLKFSALYLDCSENRSHKMLTIN